MTAAQELHHGHALDAVQTHAIALAMYNSVGAQQQGAIVRQAATTMVCTAMLSLGVAETVEGASPPATDPAAPPAPPQPPAPAEVAAKLKQAAPPVLAVDPSELGGKVYQSVAQSSALAVQDAADCLRNISTIATTAAGVALAQYLTTGNGPAYEAAMAAQQQMMAAAVANFEAIGASSAQLLKTFPKDA